VQHTPEDAGIRQGGEELLEPEDMVKVSLSFEGVVGRAYL
jgi:hypothetical protein